MIRIINFQQFKPLTARFLNKFAMIRFPLPDLGEKIKQGRIKKLHVKQGDRVSEFSKLADVESDKQFTEITSPQGGIIKKIYYHEDQLCQVGDIFLDIDTNTATPAQSQNASPKTQQQPIFQPIQQTSLKNEDFLASATIKMLAREQKIDLSKVQGTGRKGRILKEDLINYTENIKSQSIQAKKLIPKIVDQQKIVSVGEITKVSMSGIQKELYNLSSYSCSIPHLYFQQNFEVTELLEITQKIKNNEKKISLLSLLIKTFSLAVNKYPRVNSIYSLQNQFSYKQVPFQNLLLPIFNKNSLSFSLINNLEGHSIVNIQDKLDSFSNSQPSLNSINQNVGNATICLSNIGDIGGLSFNPLIYGEIACHAAIGTVRQKVVSINGTLKKSKSVEVVMGADHRVLDGATVGRFTMAWKQLSENPRLAFINMI